MYRPTPLPGNQPAPLDDLDWRAAARDRNSGFPLAGKAESLVDLDWRGARDRNSGFPLAGKAESLVGLGLVALQGMIALLALAAIQRQQLSCSGQETMPWRP